MVRQFKFNLYSLCILMSSITMACGHGLLLLYRPRDISHECALSQGLRFDLSFGMGMSDTITLVFRTLTEIDYECAVEIVVSAEYVHLLVVIRFPGDIGPNCAVNQDAFTVLKKDKCLRICDLLGGRDIHSPYFAITVKGRIRFRFLSNSSINTDINANLYEVTATAARIKPKNGCVKYNETICTYKDIDYCFTNFVVCDGIKNCGGSDWFDERKSECEYDAEKIGYTSVIAVFAALLCAIIIAGHLLLRCLPPITSSFYIFNANEDNRLRINSIFKSPETRSHENERGKRISIIPVFSSSSSDTVSDDFIIQKQQTPNVTEDTDDHSYVCKAAPTKSPVKSMTEKLNKRLRNVTRFGRFLSKDDVLNHNI